MSKFISDNTFNSKEKNIVYYYVCLCFLLLTWTNPVSLPPFPIRIIFLLLVLIPVLKYYQQWYPIAFCSLIILSMARYAPSYMVSTPPYVFLIVLCLLLIKPPVNNINRPKFLVAISVYIAIINLWTHFEVKDVCFSFISIYILSKYLDASGKTIILFLSSFISIGFILSLEYLVVGKNFVDIYSTSEIERMGWMDPNVFGCIIGMGILSAMVCLLYKIINFKYSRLLLFAVIIVSLIAFLINASRGASLALFLAISLMLLISPVKKCTRVIAIIGAIVVVLILSYLHYFDNLIFRLSLENASTGGERTIIWATKTEAFFSEYNLFQILFGLGDYYACYLGYDYYLGFHSDYFAMLVKYGIVGFIMLLYLLLYPIRKAQNNRIIIIIFVAYLSMCIFSLDLINSGHIAFFYFYMFLLTLGKSNSIINYV